MGLIASFALFVTGFADFAVRCLEMRYTSLGYGIFRVVMKPSRIRTRFSPDLAERFFVFSYLSPPQMPLSSCVAANGGGLSFHHFDQVRSQVPAA